MRPTTGTKLVQFQTSRVVTSVLDRGVIALATLRARQVNYWSNVFTFFCHLIL